MLEDEDGPMLELLKAFHTATIELPSRRTWRPDRERLAERYDRFRAAS
jgi:putative restriction endonuclease